MKRDPSNIMYLHTADSIYDADGQVLKFHRQKYIPKVKRIQRFLGSRRDLNILDVGVGYGGFLKVLEQEGYQNLYRMDPFPMSLAIASRYISADLREGRIEDESWLFASDSFDAITCLGAIEH